MEQVGTSNDLPQLQLFSFIVSHFQTKYFEWFEMFFTKIIKNIQLIFHSETQLKQQKPTVSSLSVKGILMFVRCILT